MDANTKLKPSTAEKQLSTWWPGLGAWMLEAGPNGLMVCYQNHVQRQHHCCGVLRSDTPPDMIVAFIASEGDAGDVVFLDQEFWFYLCPETIE